MKGENLIGKQKQFNVTVEYQGVEPVFSGDMMLLFQKCLESSDLKEIYGDVKILDVE